MPDKAKKDFPCDGCPSPSACIKAGQCLMEKLK